RHVGPIRHAQFSPDGTRLVTVCGNLFSPGASFAQVWDAGTGRQLGHPLDSHGALIDGGYSADGRHLVTTSNDGAARVWDAITGKPVGQPMSHPSWVLRAAFSPDGRRVVTGGADGVARVWDAETGAP